MVEETLLSSGATETQLRETCDFPRSKIALQGGNRSYHVDPPLLDAGDNGGGGPRGRAEESSRPLCEANQMPGTCAYCLSWWWLEAQSSLKVALWTRRKFQPEFTYHPHAKDSVTVLDTNSIG